MNGLTPLKGIILGLIQGATEFFPISSSAHLVIAQTYLGVRDLAHSLAAFNVALQLGTLVAALIFFRWDLACLVGGWIKPLGRKLEQKKFSASFTLQTGRHLLPLVLVGAIPTAVLGAIFHHFVEDLFADTLMVSIFMLVTGSIIFSTQKIVEKNVDLEKMTFKQALLIGLARIGSVLPGVSRSGITMAAGLFLQLKPEAAFRYSFLVMIPVAAVSILLDLKEFFLFPVEAWGPAILGAITACFVGYNCLKILLKLMVEEKFYYFAYYCWVVGGLVILKEIIF